MGYVENEVSVDIMSYILGGKAEFTLAQDNARTGKVSQAKYRVDSNDKGNIYFVRVWNGSEYKYQAYFNTTEKTIKVGKNVPSEELDVPALKALAWVFSHADNMPKAVHIYHNGRCSRCGRKLTDAESLRTGLGPTCREKRR